MSDFVHSLGDGYFAHLLSRLSDQFARGFEVWNAEVGLSAPPRTHSTLRLLNQQGSLSVTEIARTLRQSHPLVITWLRALTKLGLVRTSSDTTDGRRSVVQLTDEGRAEVTRQLQLEETKVKAYAGLFKECGDPSAALWRIEAACRARGFADRLRDETPSAERRKVAA